MSDQPIRLSSGVDPGDPSARLHRTIFAVSVVLFGLLILFSMLVMPFFVIRFGWGYKP